MLLYKLPFTAPIVIAGSTGLGVAFAAGATGAAVLVVDFGTVLPAPVKGGAEFNVGGVTIVGVAALLASVGDNIGVEPAVFVGVGELSTEGVGVSEGCVTGVTVCILYVNDP